jgi:hypothetical protein
MFFKGEWERVWGDLKMNNPSKPLIFNYSKLRKFGEEEEGSGFTYI